MVSVIVFRIFNLVPGISSYFKMAPAGNITSGITPWLFQVLHLDSVVRVSLKRARNASTIKSFAAHIRWKNMGDCSAEFWISERSKSLQRKIFFALFHQLIDKCIIFLIAETAAKTVKQRRPMVLDVNWFYGSVAWKPRNVPRRHFRLNDVSWSSVATSLLDNSGYQTDREIYDHAAAISLFAWRFRRSHERCKTRQIY